MSGRLDKLNKQISKQIGVDLANVEQVNVTKDDAVFEKYEALLENGKIFKMRFDSCTADGTFSKREADVMLVLPSSSVEKVKDRLNAYSTTKMLNLDLFVKVVEVDRENRRIFCEMPAAAYPKKETMRAALNREIAALLAKGKSPVVWGKVIEITPKSIRVDILNQGVIGSIDVSHWQKCYTRQLTGVCNVGEFFQFEIIRRMPAAVTKNFAVWKLSRRNLTKDAWGEVDLDVFKPGGTIMVECIERPVSKSYWWGRSDMLPGIELMGDYTMRFQGGKSLIEGVRYLCKIVEVSICEEDARKNRFKVVPFDVYPGDAVKLAQYTELMRRRPFGADSADAAGEDGGK